MKRIAIPIILIVIVVSSIVIWNKVNDTTKQEESTEQGNHNQAIDEQEIATKDEETPADQQVDPNQQQVNQKEEMKISIPASLFEEMTEQQIKEQLEQDGARDIVVENGEISYVIEKQVYEENVQTMQTQISEMMAQLNNQTVYTSIKGATTNEDYTRFQLTVDRKQYEDSFDSLAIFSLMTSVVYYFNYQGNATYELTMQLIDSETNEVFQEEFYPQQD
jgi:type II secretory pathway pseudopilin PulG